MSGSAPENRPAFISAKGVGVSYWMKGGVFRRDRYFPLKEINLEIYRGESLGVVGRNGCGKSTLLRLLAGVMAPDYGQLFIPEGTRTTLLSLQLGFVNYLSGRENAILSGMYLGMSRREIESKMDDITHFAELGEFMDHPLATYSSGMRARLGFAVAFQVNPDVLLVDEITGVGDLQFREKSYAAMKERLNSRDTTIVFVSHQSSQVRAMCDRAIWIDEGKVKADGDVESVLALYENAMTPLEIDPKEQTEKNFREALRYIEFTEGNYTPERAYIWLRRQASFRINVDMQELAFSLAPSAAALRIYAVIRVDVDLGLDGKATTMEFSHADAQDIIVERPRAGQIITIVTDHDYCPADMGATDTRSLAVALSSLRVSL